MNIDLHFHHTPRFFLDELQGANPWGKSLHGAGDALSIRIGPIEIPVSPEHWDLERTLAVMDARRIDVAAVSPTPMLCGRWDHGARVRSELAHLKRLPSASVRRLYYDSLTHSADALELLVRTVGAERIVLGSDYPYDMGDERTVERIEAAAFLEPREKRLVLGETASALLGRA